MMNDNLWKLDPTGVQCLDRADTIARDVVAPAAAEVDGQASFPAAAIEGMREAGLLGLLSRPEVGGLGQSLRTAMAVCERLARECPSTAMVSMMHFCGSAVLERCGSEKLRREVAQDGKLTTLAFSESGSRSHFWVPVSTAEPVGDEIRLNASKQLITAAGKADIYIWSSRPARAEGLSTLWAVPSHAEGLSCPTPYRGLGLRGNNSSPIRAENVTIGRSHQLGEDGQGFELMMGVVMPHFALQSAAVSLGLMEGALERTVAHVTGARFAYDGSAIADFPQARAKIASMRLKSDMLRGFLLDAVDALEQERADATLRVLESKLAGAETSLEVLDLAMRVCGGAAYRKDVAVERYFRDSRAASVMAPVTDALYDFVGKAVCGMPVFG